MKILVCGSRTWSDKDKIEKVLKYIEKYLANGESIEIIHGYDGGAELIANRFALENNWKLETFSEELPDLFIAFWDGKSKGTGNMIELALADKNIPTILVVFDFTDYIYGIYNKV